MSTLSQETDEQLAAQAVNGHEQEIVHLLLKRHNALIVNAAHTLSFKEIPLDDRLNCCRIGFMYAVREYDPSKGAKLTTYAVWRMKEELQRVKRQLFSWMDQKIDAPPIHSDIDLEDESVWEGVSESYIKQPEQEARIDEQASIIRQAFKGLRQREQDIFCHYHGLFGYDEMTSPDLAEEYGISRQRIEQILVSVWTLVQGRIKGRFSKEDLI